MTLGNPLARNAASVPDRVAVVGGGEQLTYAELEGRAAAAARRLASLGAGAGKRVALVAEPSLDLVVMLHGLMKLGAVSVPLDPRLGGSEVERRVALARPHLVVDDLGQVEDAPVADVALDAQIDLEAPHCLLFTSGTTGAPKPVELTYGNHFWSATGSAFRIGVAAEDRWLCCLPLHHVGGLSIVLRSVLYGTAIVIEPFEAGRIAEVIATERVTITSVVATALSRLLDAGAELERLRCVLLGGGPAPGALVEATLEAGVPLAPTYGLTEAASQVATLPPGGARQRPGSAGAPLLPCRVRIEDGEILVSGPNVSREALGSDGWLRTGDLGHLDADGHLYVLGRSDEKIVTGGENVTPRNVEQALRAHPDVAEVRVAARPDPEWQQAVVASVVLRDGAEVGEDELRQLCRARLASYEVPKEIRFVPRLP